MREHVVHPQKTQPVPRVNVRGRTWSADRPSGLAQSRLRESLERTAYEREVNAPPEPARVPTTLDPLPRRLPMRLPLPHPYSPPRHGYDLPLPASSSSSSRPLLCLAAAAAAAAATTTPFCFSSEAGLLVDFTLSQPCEPRRRASFEPLFSFRVFAVPLRLKIRHARY